MITLLNEPGWVIIPLFKSYHHNGRQGFSIRFEAFGTIPHG